MNVYDIRNPTIEDTDAQESGLNQRLMPYRQFGQQVFISGQVGRGTTRLIDELSEMVREGQYIGYYISDERLRDPILVAVNALGDETLLQMKAATVFPHLLSQLEAANLASRLPVPDVHLRPEPPKLDLGSIPTVVETEAEELLARLPGSAVRRMIDAVRDWITEHSHIVSRARVSVITEPEDIGWTEVVLQLCVETDTQTALSLWDDLAARLDAAKERLNDRERAMLNSALGVHLVWSEDDEGEV